MHDNHPFLSTIQVSGCFPINSSNPPSVVVRVPQHACTPACVSVRNMDAAAIIYLKWVNDSAGGLSALNIADAPTRLAAGESFTWDAPPRQALLVALSTVNLALLGVEGNWCTV